MHESVIYSQLRSVIHSLGRAPLILYGKGNVTVTVREYVCPYKSYKWLQWHVSAPENCFNQPFTCTEMCHDCIDVPKNVVSRKFFEHQCNAGSRVPCMVHSKYAPRSQAAHFKSAVYKISKQQSEST